jgi:hypothetical protein
MAVFLFFFFVVVIPIAICIIHYKRPEWFSRWKLLLWIIGSALLSWCYVNACIWIPYKLELFLPRGPELVFALLFGWMYLWLASIPTMIIYAVWRVIRKFMRSYENGKQKSV